ncbi:MAG: sugar transferase [Phycisphaerae bacterium]|nr:sugar transferase [Phycisphaerae bacterium]
MLYFLYSDLPLRQRKEADIETVEETESIFRQETLPVRNPVSVREETDFVPAHDKLKEHYLKDWPNLYQFLSQNVDLSEIDNSETIVLNTHTLFNVETIENNSLTLFINLDLINDIRRINQYFLEVHKKFYNGSYFVGRAETIDTHHSKIFSKYPGSFAEVIYALDFLIFRVLPKIPLINRLYFLITRGKNRVISKAEILGRLYFCGFKVSATREIGDNFYFIACKIKNPAVDRNPSYGPLIKLRRIGYDGRIISVNKFRTMHPYSEYLQDYIYEQNHLQSNGKFNNDFRVTAWGRVFRKMWIDELPQLANFFRGDLSLVGVRALSPHYFKLYPRDLQDLRVKFKPGLVPPYYADMPDSFAEIVDSERTYLLAKQQKPFTTDIKYFCKAMYNIFFNNARSR